MLLTLKHVRVYMFIFKYMFELQKTISIQIPECKIFDII